MDDHGPMSEAPPALETGFGAGPAQPAHTPPAMKVYVRNGAGRYYCRVGLWAVERSAAFDFEQPEHASALIRAEGWQGMQIVLAYERPACDLVLPQNPLEPPS